MKKTIFSRTALFAVLLSICSLAGFAQNTPKAFGKTLTANPENGKVRCVTTEYEEYLKQQFPNRETSEQFEAWLAPKIRAMQAQRLASPQSTNIVITIPVVVHVIHNGDAVGANENIADGQVISQITVLNQDFRRMEGTPGENSDPVGADVEIEFCLAKRDPEGNATNGINRVNLQLSSYDDELTIETYLKPSTQWDPDQYLNIWVCNFGGDMSDILGYAQFPSGSGLNGINNNGGLDYTDGVIIGYRYFGSKAIFPAGNNQFGYDRGRTTTHEVGHYLGLRHINGDNTQASSCTVNATDSNNDFCPDTPATRFLNYECVYTDSCPGNGGPDMIENYMDYTPDACMNIFTQNQKSRMLTVMNNATRRKLLKTSLGCVPPALSSPEFELLNGINLYPNPATDVLNIAVANSELPDSYVIYNNLGQTMANVKVNSDANLNVNTSNFSNGVYFIKVVKGNQTKTLKFIKK
ncbi:MAG: T9SS type A sorting domain-containing protein [Flavobacterium sp.]|nr:MAG: T9SS type A sorting domain-containing protein [Flavobacterium sp.]